MTERRGPPTIDGLHSLKIDNISFRTSAEDLRRLFERYGEIGDIHIPRDRFTKQSKGFGFVRFYSKRDADHALEKTDGKWEDGREMRVAFAHYKRPFDYSRRDDRGRGSRRYSRSKSRSRSRSPRRRRSRSKSRTPKEENGRRSRSRSPVRRSKRDQGSKSASRSP